MASQITVLGPGARRHVVKVTPTTYLSDVFNEACSRFKLDSLQYGLKHNEKAVDLSRTIRLSGLTSGAKLELTQVSRSPSVVSVALQLSDNSRLLDKFPSDTSLWLILRKFEAGVAGNAGQKNFTGRGVPRTGAGSTSGRLYHEAPVLHIMGRDYSSFVDLQKSLGQLGFNNGSVLLKLSFYTSEEPLEEAMERIAKYFKSVDGDSTASAQAGSVASTTPQVSGASEEPQQAVKEAESQLSLEPDTVLTPPHQENQVPLSPQTNTLETESMHYTPTTADGSVSNSTRPTLIYAPPSSTTPQAAQQTHNPQDFVPTVEHAKAHQASLNRASLNRRLPTDAEIEAEKAAAVEKLQEIKEITIKVRFPDQSSAVAPFRSSDSAEDLYRHVQSLMSYGDEQFSLQVAALRGQTTLVRNQKKLVADLGLTGRVMVNVVWAPEASLEARKGRSMKAEVAQKQQQYQVKEVTEPEDNEVVSGASDGKQASNSKEKKRDGMPKWLKGFGKK